MPSVKHLKQKERYAPAVAYLSIMMKLFPYKWNIIVIVLFRLYRNVQLQLLQFPIYNDYVIYADKVQSAGYVHRR